MLRSSQAGFQAGYEYKAVTRAYRILTKTNFLRGRISSVFAVPWAVGNVYVEADAALDVHALSARLNGLYFPPSNSFVPPEDCKYLLLAARRNQPISEGTWVRLRRSKKYKGDLGRVLSVTKEDVNRLLIAVVPRILFDKIELDHQDKAIQNRQRKGKGKEGEAVDRPRPELFDESRVKTFFGPSKVKRTRDGNYRFNNQTFDKFGLHIISSSCSAVDAVLPNHFEAEQFILAYKGSDVQLDSLKIERFWDWADLVQFTRGPFAGSQGRLHGTIEGGLIDVAVISSDKLSIERVVKSPVDELERIILAGDNVEVKVGRQAGRKGLVVIVDDTTVSFLDSELTVLVRRSYFNVLWF
jgi:transcription elongation factor SPT5